jgi:hypothetical protein
MPRRPPASSGPPAPSASAAEAPRLEMRAAPPFLTWRAIYAIVLGALGAQVILYAALTALYR